jgi:predicted amidohydrolase YtcJ
VMMRDSAENLKANVAKYKAVGLNGNHLTIASIKMVADGALGSRGAALLAPYSDEPSNTGLMTTTPDAIYMQTLAASRAGFQTCVHAIGDRANRIVLDVFERVQREVPGSRDLRMRVEHAQILAPSDIPRFARLNLIASMQSTHATSDMPWVATRLGQERTEAGAYVWQKLTKTGVVLANGSDFPVEEPNPILGFYAAITREDPSGEPEGGWMPEEKMSRLEALKSFTTNAAYAAHAEKDLGSLEVGKLADMVLLDRNIMRVEPKEILKTSVITTIVGGEVTYERK